MTQDMSSPQISVSIINYRTAEMTLDCVRSVLLAAADVPDVAIHTYVVDNASGDGSADRIADWITAEDVSAHVTLIRSPTNSGFSGGHNQGITASRSDFVLVLNSDALLRPGFFAPLLAATQTHPKAGRFVPRLEEADGTAQISCFRWHTAFSELIRGAQSGPVTRAFDRWNVPLSLDPKPAEVDWVSFACVLLRREMIDAIGPMDEGYFLYFEDCEYNLRAARAGWDAVLVAQAQAAHVGGGSGTLVSSQQTRARLPEYYWRSRSRFFYQAHGRLGLLAANVCWTAGWALARLRHLIRRRPPTATIGEPIDIWTGFTAPLATDGRPGS
ncbi:MAG: glycosyltransferase family 2 protein [Paracoccaceae bacterium]